MNLRNNNKGFSLDKVYPWGRSLEEYERMFALTDHDLKKRILGIGDGPASFNAEATAAGRHVLSADPLYRFTADEIRGRIDEVYDEIVEGARQSKDKFVWSRIKDADELGRIRLSAMNRFLDDYPTGKKQGRYVEATLPSLPFADDSFDLAVCSHFLFLYSNLFDFAFHLESIRELLRVAREVRCYPLLTMEHEESPHLSPLIKELSLDGYTVERVKVDYEFQRGATEMVRFLKL